MPRRTTTAIIFLPNKKKGSHLAARSLISVIDDDDAVRRALVALVRSAGYEARSFASAEEFLDCGAAKSSACVIADIHMPGMSGIDLKRHLASVRCPVPIIMITALGTQRIQDNALASGAAAFLKKPFEADALLTCLKTLIES